MMEGSGLRPTWSTKADIQIAQIATGGTLVREQVEEYFLVAIAAAVMLEKVQTVIMDRDQKEWPVMTTFGDNVWQPAAEYTALTDAERVRPGFTQTILTAAEIMSEVRWPEHLMKQQVEREQLKNTLLGYLALHHKGGWDNLIIRGDTVSGATTFLRLFNGMIAGATSYVYPAGAVALSSTVLETIMFTMLQQYRSGRNLGFYTSEEAQSAYLTELETRNTNFGDKVIVNGEEMPAYRKKQVTSVPRFPTTLGIGGNETVVMYCDAKDFLFGLRENMLVATEYNPRQRATAVITTAWVSEGWKYQEMEVKSTGILS